MGPEPELEFGAVPTLWDTMVRLGGAVTGARVRGILGGAELGDAGF